MENTGDEAVTTTPASTDMTVAEIAAEAHDWRRPNLEAALEHERANAKRKGAIAALESALADKETH